MIVEVDHDSGRLVLAAPGRDKATLAAFFDALGTERRAGITRVSADGADWISAVVADGPERGALRGPVPRGPLGN